MFSDWLQRQLERRHLTQRALATYIGVSPPTVSKWVSGDFRPDPAQCHKVAAYFHMPEEEVLRAAGHLSAASVAVATEERPSYIHPDMDAMLRELDWEVQAQVVAALRGAALSLGPMLDDERRAERRAQTKSRRFSGPREAVPAGEGEQ